MTQFDLTAISNFTIAVLSFICAISFFLHSRTNVAHFIISCVAIFNTALLIAELKSLIAALGWRKQETVKSAALGLIVGNSDLMENFSLFYSYAINGVILTFVIFLAYAFFALRLYRNSAGHVFFTIFHKLSSRIMTNLETSYSKVSIIYFSIFICIMLSNLFGLIPFSYTITSGLGMPTAGGLISFLMTVGTLVLASGLCAAGGFLPAGTNKEIAPLVVIVEVLSFFAKFASLIIRLFANLFAGHLLLKVLYVGIFTVSSLLSFAAVGTELIFFSFVSAGLGLEIILAALQALVFLALALIYFKDARHFVYAH